ncbi:MAG TPA: hypothetical protein VGO61_22425 [Steroidobacteraceae bacterium]|jgi:hypothetical protein|nr:hypothetical protein [Steroidobacteraceae bacterium]
MTSFAALSAADAGRPGEGSIGMMRVAPELLEPDRVTLLDCRYDTSRRDAELRFEKLVLRPQEDLVTAASLRSIPDCESR